MTTIATMLQREFDAMGLDRMRLAGKALATKERRGALATWQSGGCFCFVADAFEPEFGVARCLMRGRAILTPINYPNGGRRGTLCATLAERCFEGWSAARGQCSECMSDRTHPGRLAVLRRAYERWMAEHGEPIPVEAARVAVCR